MVAYFPEANALYSGDRVEIMGVKVGAIDKIEPAGDKMKVTFHYDNKYKVPANATASILNPSLVASRLIQLAPPYTGGPVLADNAVIPTTAPRCPSSGTSCVTRSTASSPNWAPPRSSPRARSATSSSPPPMGWRARAKQINKTLNGLSQALTTLNQGRGDFFGVVRSLALFVNALYPTTSSSSRSTRTWPSSPTVSLAPTVTWPPRYSTSTSC